MSWREFWNADTPIYVNERHKRLHYALVARDIAALVPGPDATVLDFGCGEALSADRVTASCARLILCDGAPLVRQRLAERSGADPKVRVIAPEELETVPDQSLDLVVVNSVLQYLSHDELASLLGQWRSKLKTGGRLVLADIIPPDTGPVADAGVLLGFAWRGGFLLAALVGLARTAFSSYRTLRQELGLTHYTEAEMAETLRERGFAPVRRAANLGHNPHRITIEGTVLRDD